jgi:hypothetical protein
MIVGAYGTIYALCISSRFFITPIHEITNSGFSYCVGTRRRTILDHQQIVKCREILDTDHATNFETRMVAEINLYWVIYECCSTMPVDLPRTQAALHEWRQEWKFLFGRILTPRFTISF